MSNFISSDFEPSSAAAWKQKIQFELDGADYNETLLTKTNEGITINPFYHQDNFEKLNIPQTKRDFKICQEIQIDSTIIANLKAVNAIKNGATSLKIKANEEFDFNELFKNLLNKKIDFHFQLNFLSEVFIQNLYDYLKNETTYYNLDIIGNLAQSGNWFESFNNDFKIIERLVTTHKSSFLLSVNVDLYQNAGANTVQQVAYALCHFNEYLTYLGENIAKQVQFNFATGSNYFFEISKIRAFRYLHKLILQNYNTETEALIYTKPTLRNKTLYDYNTNILRTTNESMSSILGGSNTISSLSYDDIFSSNNKLGERIARNQLIILKEESHFKNTQNIATDSYYIESITKQIAEKALDIFKEIEASGGFLKHLKKGTIQRKITENAKKEQTQFNNGELVLLGSNKFDNESDKMKNALDKDPFSKKKPNKTLIIPIISRRLSERLEQKRLKDEA